MSRPAGANAPAAFFFINTMVGCGQKDREFFSVHSREVRMRALTHEALVGNEASVTKIVEALILQHFGDRVGPWPIADAKRHMRKQRRRTIGGFLSDIFGESTGVTLGVTAAVLAVAVPAYLHTHWAVDILLYAAVVALAWIGLYRLFLGTNWQTNALVWNGLPDGQLPYYMRDGKAHTLPREVNRFAGALIPLVSESLQVSFIGEDPVLWAYKNGEGIPALIWDENPDGSITLIKPPAH
jgi:hypothetical protein